MPGGFGKLVLRVPTESDTASTTKVQVQLPADTPFAFVSTKPHPGWTVATTERKLANPITAEGFTLSKAVATVTWTASGASAGIGPGQFDEFELSAGALPLRRRHAVVPDDPDLLRRDRRRLGPAVRRGPGRTGASGAHPRAGCGDAGAGRRRAGDTDPPTARRDGWP